MTSTATAPAIDLALASVAPPPELPAVAAPPRPPAEVERAVTPEGLRDMLAARKRRSDGWTPVRVAAFLEALAETGSVSAAAKYVDMSTSAAYHLRNHPEAQGFREAWDQALAPRFEELTDIAMERIRNGVEKLRWWKDEVVGTERVFSDRLLIHMLRRADPDRLTVTDDPRAAARAALSSPRPAQSTSGATRAAPPPPVLPMADDFIVAAAVDTGRLGWDPDHDADESDWPDDVREIVERKRAAFAAHQIQEKAAYDEEMRVRRAADAEGAARMNARRAEDEKYRAPVSKLASCSSSRGRGSP